MSLPENDESGMVGNAMSDNVNHPAHYTSSPAKCQCGRTIECIDVTEHMGFNLGNVVKYVWRADLKGKALEDLEKARWYLEREIAKRSNACDRNPADGAMHEAEVTL